MKKRKSSKSEESACYYKKWLLKKLKSMKLTVSGARMETCFSLWKMTPYRGKNQMLSGVGSSRVDSVSR
jgi:hypothetical protein